MFEMLEKLGFQSNVFWLQQYNICGGGVVSKSCPTFATPWTVALQAPLSMGFSRQECWDGLPFPSPGDLPKPVIKPDLLHCRRTPALQMDSLQTELRGISIYNIQTSHQVCGLWNQTAQVYLYPGSAIYYPCETIRSLGLSLTHIIPQPFLCLKLTGILGITLFSFSLQASIISLRVFILV